MTRESLPPLFLKGLAEFNRRDFFACHETLEELWKEQEGEARNLTQGVIQVAVAYYHYLRGNREGSIKLLGRGLARVRQSGTSCASVNWQKFAAEAELTLSRISSEDDLESQPFETPKLELLADSQDAHL